MAGNTLSPSDGPLPSQPERAGDQPSDGAASRSAAEGAAQRHAAPEGCFPLPPEHDLQMRQPSIRERAFDAAQRLVLSQPHLALGRLEQGRIADYVLETAARFEAWMLQPWASGFKVKGYPLVDFLKARGVIDADSKAAPEPVESCNFGDAASLWNDHLSAALAAGFTGEEIDVIRSIAHDFALEFALAAVRNVHRGLNRGVK